jgi:phosphomannomutase
VGLVRDSFSALALILDRMCAGDTITPLADLADGLPRLVMKKTKIDLTPDLRGQALAAAIDRIEAAFPAATASRLDGLRLDWDGGWLLVRGSNTEPIVRIVAEADREATVDEALARAAAALRGS